MQLGEHELTLLADRAVWRPAAGALYLADAHFGKAAAFRAAGIAVPEAAAHDLQRLDALIARTGASRLVILGDMLHAAAGRTDAVLDKLRRWRERHDSLDVMLVRGNHDRAAGDPPPALGITCVDEPFDDAGLRLCHDPACADADGDAPTLAGHLHPAAMLKDYGRTTVRLPCFHRRGDRLILPAFGSFTGMKAVRRAAATVRYAVSPAGVFAIDRIDRCP